MLTLWQAWRTRGREVASVMLLIGYLPYFAVWWAHFSYEDRFLLVLTPLIAVMGARCLLTLGAWLKIPRQAILRQPPRLSIGLMGLLILCTLPAANDAVQFKFDILHHPLMSDSDKHRVRLGGRYDVALFLQTLPADSRTLTDDTLLPYPAFPAQVIVGGWPASAADLKPYGYWALKPGETLPAWAGAMQPSFQSGGYRIYGLAF